MIEPLHVSRRIFAVCLMMCSAALFASEPPDDPKLALSFVADSKAYRTGDVLTVLITEVAVASTSARTRTDKEESAQASLRSENQAPWGMDVGLGSDFDGGGQIERSGKLLAKLAVTIEGKDATGNLRVRGEQEIAVNNERQRIRLEGFVRPEDIAPDNTVPSWRVSDARIDFIGKGILAQRQSPGLVTRILRLFRLN